MRKGTCAEAGDAMVVAHGERAGVAQRQEDPTVLRAWLSTGMVLVEEHMQQDHGRIYLLLCVIFYWKVTNVITILIKKCHNYDIFL